MFCQPCNRKKSECFWLKGLTWMHVGQDWKKQKTNLLKKFNKYVWLCQCVANQIIVNFTGNLRKTVVHTYCYDVFTAWSWPESCPSRIWQTIRSDKVIVGWRYDSSGTCTVCLCILFFQPFFYQYFRPCYYCLCVFFKQNSRTFFLSTFLKAVLAFVNRIAI